MEQVPFDGPILVITGPGARPTFMAPGPGPTFTKLADDASCDTDDLTSLDAICLTFTCWRGLMFRDQV